jgi:hypothetical protein
MVKKSREEREEVDDFMLEKIRGIHLVGRELIIPYLECEPIRHIRWIIPPLTCSSHLEH